MFVVGGILHNLGIYRVFTPLEKHEIIINFLFELIENQYDVFCFIISTESIHLILPLQINFRHATRHYKFIGSSDIVEKGSLNLNC